MIVRVDKNTPTLRPGMWLVDRDGKRWQWSEYDSYGVLTDGKGVFRLLAGGNRMWMRGEVTDAIARGELTPESDAAATVEVETLPVNTVIWWADDYWQVEGRNVIGKPSAPDSVRIRAWPNLIEGVVAWVNLDPSTPVTPIGVPVVEDKT